MLLAKQETWSMSARVPLSRDSFVLSNVEPTGSMGDIKIFAAPGGIILPNLNPDTHSIIVDLPEPESLIQRKRDVLARFIHVLKPLVELYKIPQTSLQVFADKEGQLICLNRSGCLVMNLRYFEAWRTSWVSASPAHLS
jgi:hypothetical protein